MRTNLLSLFIPFIRLQLDVERLMYILAFNPVLFKLKLYVILNLALLTLARIKFSPLFAFARLEFTDDRFKRIAITKIYVYKYYNLCYTKSKCMVLEGSRAYFNESYKLIDAHLIVVGKFRYEPQKLEGNGKE